MKYLVRFLATIGAITLLLIAYSAIRSPSGTLLTFQFLGEWWLTPFESDPLVSDEIFPSTISNPERYAVAGVPLEDDYSILIQDELYANFIGDGHCIVVATLDANSNAEFPPSQITWNPISSLDQDVIESLQSSTPYAAYSEELDKILNDSDALYSIERLRGSGESFENVCVFIASPNQKALFEWSSDF